MLKYGQELRGREGMELRVLSYFLTVAREENITKAAALLHVTQPTISRQLMQLEEELGVKLFKRSNHSILLTEQGMLLKRRAQELVSLAEKTKRELSQEEELGGEISIGSGEYQNSSLLAEILAAFHERHPGVWFHMFSGNSDDIKERMERGPFGYWLFSGAGGYGEICVYPQPPKGRMGCSRAGGVFACRKRICHAKGSCGQTAAVHPPGSD